MAMKKNRIIKRDLSGPQKGVHFSEFSSGSLPVNTIAVRYFFEAFVPITHFEAAVNQTLISFPTLRMRMSSESVTARQYITPFAPLAFSDYTPFADEKECKVWADSLVKEKIPYWDSPLADFHPFRIGNDRYGFVFRAHHIISDAWTYQLVTEEIFANLKRNYPYELKRERKGSYLLYLKEEESYLNSERYVSDKDYWKQALLPVPPRVGFFFSKHPSSHSAERNNFTIDDGTSRRINDFCSLKKITPSVFFLWILSATIALASNNREFLIGMLTHNRISKKEKRIAGMFVNTIALKIKSDFQSSLWDNLQKIQQELAGGMRRQRFPVSSLFVNEESGKETVFNSLEIVYSYNSVKYPFDSRFHYCGAENFPLLIRPYIDDESRFSIDMDYRTDSIDIDRILILQENFLTVLEAALDDCDRLLHTTPWISSRHINRVLKTFNKPVALPEQKVLVHQILETREATDPGAPALSFNGQTLSYGELNIRANRIARKLRETLGEGEHLVALLMDRSFDLVAVLYGILKAGYAYVPINSHHPAKRNRLILEEAKPSLILSDCRETAELYGGCLVLSEWEDASARTGNLDLDLPMERLAYVIFTSGSTGRPKGVMVEHGAVVNRLLWMKDYYNLGPEDCFIQKTPYTFDVSVPELFGWPLGGGRLHLLLPGEEKNPPAIIDALKKHSASIVHFVPSMLRAFLEYVETAHRIDELKSLRLVACSGEVLPGEAASRFFGLFERASVRLLNLYGPTEAAVEVTAHECSGGFHRLLPIGFPISNVQILILSPRGDILPPGIRGELCIAGPCLARGYLNAPDLTEKAFTAHPRAAGGRIYRTGDLASWNESGEILFHGRMDHQVKIRGNRIELGEIEGALESHPAISAAVVLVQNDKRGNQSLACHYTASQPCSDRNLRDYLTDRLPPYMIPQLWKEEKRLPLTSSGKIDRNNIEPVAVESFENSDRNRRGFTIESAIREEWERVLPDKAFSDDDDFFSLGGDSFGLITIFASLEKKFHVTLQELFDHSTINDLASFILENKTLTLSPEIRDLRVWDQVSLLARERKRLREYEQSQYELYYSTLVQDKTFETILLTGGTGFFGIHLAKTILERSVSSLFLLVRGETEEKARNRFAELWSYYFAGSELTEWRDRLIFLCGDLTKEKLGLDKALWDSLGDRVDTIIHAGANVRHYGQYEDYVGTNIRGTETLLSLMEKGRDKEYHYISTISLHLLERRGGFGFFYESDFPSEPHLENNYLESKWEAERILRTSGMNVRIYRLGNLVGSSDKGINQINRSGNAFLRSLDAYVRIGAVPDLDEEFIDMTYVDQAAEAVWLLMRTTTPLRCFHVLNPLRIAMRDLGASFGLSVMEVGEFLDRFEKESDLFTFAPYLKYPELLFSDPRSDHTDVILKKGGHKWIYPEKEYILSISKHP